MKNFSGHVMCKGISQAMFNQKEYLDLLEILNSIFDELFDHKIPKMYEIAILIIIQSANAV